MGKYMKKSKITGDIAVMEVSPSSIGVRTRAKTLAALRTPSPDHHPDHSSLCYLQLRSRRLPKPPPPPSSTTSCTHHNPKPIPTSTLPPGSLSCNNNPCSSNNEGTEASFGDNSLDFEHRDRGVRESTPCSLIRTSDSIGTPGSTTRRRSMPVTYQEQQDDRRIVPAQREIEEFFACAEQQEARLFIEKYNFDITNGLPLPGRYEWVELTP